MAGRVAGGTAGAGVPAASLPRIAGMFLRGPSCHQPLRDASPQPCPWPCCRLSVPFCWVPSSCPVAQSSRRVSPGEVWLRHSWWQFPGYLSKAGGKPSPSWTPKFGNLQYSEREGAGAATFSSLLLTPSMPVPPFPAVLSSQGCAHGTDDAMALQLLPPLPFAAPFWVKGVCLLGAADPGI